MEKQKIFVVSDIHGHCSILKDALKNAGFEKKMRNTCSFVAAIILTGVLKTTKLLNFLSVLNTKYYCAVITRIYCSNFCTREKYSRITILTVQ